MSQSKRVIIFDTTLRDGEQSPGASMNLQEKIKIALLLEEMGVDVIEAGFPITSNGDFEAVREIAKRVTKSTVAGLARCARADIDRCWEALRSAKQPRIHSVIATSPLHMKHKLQMEPEHVHRAMVDTVSYARNLCPNVEWSAEDGSRSEHDFLCRMVESAIKAGATTINIPDTVGYAVPEEFGALIAMLINRVPNIDKAVISVHCHNDLGLGVANSLAAIQAGARQVECTVNGLGERAGNAALEEIVMALKTRPDAMPYSTGIKTELITNASRLVSAITGFAVQPNKAIVGGNAFAHESGIHQDGMLKHPGTYQIMTPESVGAGKSNLVMGKHSGRHAFAVKLKELGIELGDNALNDAFRRFKELADRKKNIFDEDIVALVGNELHQPGRIVFDSLSVYWPHGDGLRNTQMKLHVDGVLREAVNDDGNGPIEVIFNAIKKIVPHSAKVLSYQVRGVTEGADAQAGVTIKLQMDGKVATGHNADPDTLAASARAYLDALNKLLLPADTVSAG